MGKRQLAKRLNEQQKDERLFLGFIGLAFIAVLLMGILL